MRTRHGFTLIEPFGFAHGKLPAVRKRGRPAFTLIELLFVVGILAVLVTILIPVVGDVLAEARVAKCMANMKLISGAIANKLPENTGNRIFGLVHSDGTPAEVNGALGASDDLGTLTGNAMQNVWQMVESYEVSPRVFHCAADGQWTDRATSSTLKYGWTVPTEFSYGIQYPYGDYSINDTRLKDRTVIVADRNPGGAVDGGTTRHSNHKRGVVVLFYDGNVKFHKADDSLAGYAGDDIYIDSGVDGLGDPAPVDGVPDNSGDTVITPNPSR